MPCDRASLHTHTHTIASPCAPRARESNRVRLRLRLSERCVCIMLRCALAAWCLSAEESIRALLTPQEERARDSRWWMDSASLRNRFAFRCSSFAVSHLCISDREASSCLRMRHFVSYTSTVLVVPHHTQILLILYIPRVHRVPRALIYAVIYTRFVWQELNDDEIGNSLGATS